MALSEMQQTLVQGLMLMGASKLEILCIGVEMYTPEMQLEMMQWMVEHKDASPAQLLRASSEISSRMESAE